MQAENFVRVPEVTKHLGLSRKTVWDLIRNSSDPLPHYRVGRSVLIKLSEVDQWMEGKRSMNLADKIVHEVCN